MDHSVIIIKKERQEKGHAIHKNIRKKERMKERKKKKESRRKIERGEARKQ